MANITFSNPKYRDKTVYAVAGSHTETILSIARANKIPINFSCENGECGTCLVKVKSLSHKPRMGGFLTEKEKVVLKEHGKLNNEEELDNSEIGDMPPTWRLACQMIVRDEDIVVEYE
ncbi:2Fe-2S iron-sulfur cluster-binding protein [Azomonas macrocytogenes]|uniref:Ferredoxin n=1 Tax=Azomonas macrocytogenes TaxID=69962 RepID=A0A839T2E3_AZOMA|nr:2Fe-2S iron-sulfur cluster binding domain-containing protein [Azomonas macrocytogenes]MBB3102125.1 ferredoxin [Azomonas macrocytogenes]